MEEEKEGCREGEEACGEQEEEGLIWGVEGVMVRGDVGG